MFLFMHMVEGGILASLRRVLVTASQTCRHGMMTDLRGYVSTNRARTVRDGHQRYIVDDEMVPAAAVKLSAMEPARTNAKATTFGYAGTRSGVTSGRRLAW